MPRTRTSPPAKTAKSRPAPRAASSGSGAAPAGGKKILGLKGWQLALAGLVVAAVLVYLYEKNKSAAAVTAATQTPDTATGQGAFDGSGAISGTPVANTDPTDMSAAGKTTADEAAGKENTDPTDMGADGSGVTSTGSSGGPASGGGSVVQPPRISPPRLDRVAA